MRRLRAVTAVIVSVTIAALANDDDGTKLHNVPHLPGAVLLVGWPPFNLALTHGDTHEQIQADRRDWYVMPSMSRDGKLIASARPTDGLPPNSRVRPRLVPIIYSTITKTWKDYKELFIFDGSVALSPDGTRLACISRNQAGAAGQIAIFDLASARMTMFQQNATGNLSWSPDDKKIAFAIKLDPLGSIFVLDIDSGKVKKMADGTSPSWSPSGEYIAFHDYAITRKGKNGWYPTNHNRLSLVRPDGTDHKVLRTFGRNTHLVSHPVWSPDSKVILASEFQGDNNDWVKVYVLDLRTNKMTKKFKKVLPVYEWLPANPVE